MISGDCLGSLPPALIFIFGAALIPLFGDNLFSGKIKRLYLLLLPLLAFLNLLDLSPGKNWIINFLSYQLILLRVDRLSIAFGYIFVIMTFIGTVFSLHLKEKKEQIAQLLYSGASLGVIFAGDYLSLFFFWEMMSLSSVFLIWNRNSKEAKEAGFRYLFIHVLGALLLFSGIVIHWQSSGSLEFNHLGLGELSGYFILLGFAINAAIPPLHAWLTDAYPEATVTGAVFLSAFTTKTAVYTLIRGFAGTELLVWMGTLMAIYGVVYAVLENDIRKILAYHIVSQVGYMVTAVGIGTELALNGAVAHAFSHILYKGLLFMGAGAVLEMTGRNKLSELGGLYRTMPVTLALYMVGAFSISSVPLFNGFVSKSMIISAAAIDHRGIIWLALTLASVGTFLSTGLKLPYFTFFARDIGIRTKEPPANMLWAMGIASFFCIAIGILPGTLYSLLPYPVDYFPYTADHIVGTLQLLLFTALGFFLLSKMLEGKPHISLDTDWFYRKGAKIFFWVINKQIVRVEKLFVKATETFIPYVRESRKVISEEGPPEKIVEQGSEIVSGTSKGINLFDIKIIDGTVNRIGSSLIILSEKMRKIQTGYLQDYARAILVGLLILIFFLLLL